MPMLIWVLAAHTGHFVGLVMLWIIFKFNTWARAQKPELVCTHSEDSVYKDRAFMLTFQAV